MIHSLQRLVMLANYSISSNYKYLKIDVLSDSEGLNRFKLFLFYFGKFEKYMPHPDPQSGLSLYF